MRLYTGKSLYWGCAPEPESNDIHQRIADAKPARGPRATAGPTVSDTSTPTGALGCRRHAVWENIRFILCGLPGPSDQP